MTITSSWTYLLFLAAADCELLCSSLSKMVEIMMVAAVMMILRVWVMYHRSRLILYTLLALFSVEIICAILSIPLSDPRKNLTGA